MGTGIPTQVLEQERVADMAMEQAQQQQQQQQAQLDQATPSSQQVPVENPAVEVRSLADLARETPSQAIPQRSGQEFAPAPSDTVPKAEYDHLLAQHQVLQGKYNAEVPVLSRQLRELKDEIRYIREHPVTIQQPAAPSTPPHLAHLKPEERQDFQSRDEALGVQGRAVLGEVESLMNQGRREMEERLKRLEERQQHIAGDANAQAFLNAAEKLLPGAIAINKSPAFEDFLETIEPLSYQSYRTLIASAYNAGDVQRAVDIMKIYANQAGLIGNQAGPGRIAGQIKPDRAAGSTGQPKAQAPVQLIKESEVKKFYDDQARGVYGPDPDSNADVKKIRDIIDKAAEEDRILFGQ